MEIERKSLKEVVIKSKKDIYTMDVAGMGIVVSYQPIESGSFKFAKIKENDPSDK